jgi:phosphatidylserine decarboxylase
MVLIYLLATLASLFIIFMGFRNLIFLRDPIRTSPIGKVIVSPADGKVVQVMKVNKKQTLQIEKGLIGKIFTATKDVGPSCYVVSIFMSPMDVHYNRAPLSGKVLKVTHTPGLFKPVMSFEAGLVNEKVEHLIENKIIGKYKVIQISGFVARRISPFTKKGDNLKKGDKIGLIHFGSQATLILPDSVNIKIKIGDKMKAGESIIATHK